MENKQQFQIYTAVCMQNQKKNKEKLTIKSNLKIYAICYVIIRIGPHARHVCLFACINIADTQYSILAYI